MEALVIKTDLNSNKGSENVNDIRKHIVTTQEHIHRFKERVSKYIEDNYVEFMPNNSTIFDLEEGKLLEKEAYELLNSLQCSVSHFDTELLSTVRKFESVVWDLDVINRILGADEIFQMLEEISSNEYMVKLDMLKKLNNLINTSASSDVQKLLVASPCYDTIKVKYVLQFYTVKSNLHNKFQELVQFSDKQVALSCCATIQVSKDINQLQDTVLALFQAKYDVTELCDFLMDKCLSPIITKPVNVSFSDDSEDYQKFQLSYSVNNNSGGSKSDYKQVFENIKLLFHCMDNLNISVSEEQHVFSVIGEHISQRFLQLLIDECLMDAIPDTLDNESKPSIIEDILQFEKYLAELFFINRDVSNQLSKFTHNFNTLYQNRVFRRIMETGRELMQKDLQDITVMAEKNTPEDVANNPFLFPRCMVSKSVLEFVKLLNRILRQDNESSYEEGRFFNIISILINSYVTLVPQYHKEHLETLPQQSTIFYNNCMFLHHFLAKNYGIPTVSNMIKNLSATGAKYLRQQIDKQLNVLQNILQTNEGYITPTMVHECLSHLRLLESLWQPVLPVKEYNKTMGELVSVCSLMLNQQVVAKEIITPSEAKIMLEIFELFQKEAGSLFKVGQELKTVVSWQRMLLLKETLKASLTEISEMWSIGKYTEYFKADEIIGLIRSLHPDTERRALALKRIY
uniref:Centromere/kinetochore Zw10 n=1 Tax=Musca domestica TaxID=7370 RepID=A0A1I8NKD7_MUSDO